MTVDPAAEGALGIVEMHAAQILKTDDAFERRRFFAGFGAAQVVAGGESMAGIDADADAGFIFHTVDDGREVLGT